MPEDDNLHSTDKTLLQAAATGEGTVELTPDLMAQIGSNLTARTTDIARRYPDLVLHCPYETRLAVVAWAMQHIVEHARDGGTFRYLIYERLGFGPEAYVPLYQAGGMEISNEFHLPSAAGGS